MSHRVLESHLNQVSNKHKTQFYAEINIYDIEMEDRVIIIASDGVWEFLTNEQVAMMAMKFYNEGLAEQAANTIVRESAE